MREKIGGLWFEDGLLVADPICDKMDDPGFVAEIFDNSLKHNAFMQKILEKNE